MNYQPYEARMAKDTPTGMRYLVRCNRLGKWAICSWVSSTGAAIGSPECQGKYEYVMKKWHKLVGKYVSVTYRVTPLDDNNNIRVKQKERL